MSWKRSKVDQAVDALIKTNSMLISGQKMNHDFVLGLSRDLTSALKRIERLEKRLNSLEG